MRNGARPRLDLRLGGTIGFGLAVAIVAACSNHEVSPWPKEGPTSLLGRFASTPDLAAQLQNIDVETREHGLTLDRELRASLPRRGGTVVIRTYRGTDELSHETHAVRVASAQGVILAVGPLSVRDDRGRATRLVPALVDAEGGRAFTSGGDTNDDGLADILLANERGELEVWRLTPNGSTRYDVEMALPPRRAVDLGLDGVMDLEGWDDGGGGTPPGPRLVDRASFDSGKWSNTTAAAKGWHARMAAGLAAEAAPEPVVRDGGAGDTGARDAATGDAGAGAVTDDEEARKPEERLRAALERAWHRLRAGEARGKVTAELDALAIPSQLRAWFEQGQRRVLRR